MDSVKVGLLGGGQLGRMLAESANRLNVQLNVLDVENAPAKQISTSDGHITGSFNDVDSIRKLAENSDILTAEIEHVDTYALEVVASQVKIEPSWRTIRLIQDKFQQKEYLAKFGIPIVEQRELRENSERELEQIGLELGYPFMLKSKTQAYDGRGNRPVRSKYDLSAPLDALVSRPLYAEKWVTFEKELAVIVVKTKSEILSYPTVETVQEDSICKLVYAPARGISERVDKEAQELAKSAVSTFEGKGVFAVELFLMKDNSILLCEVASRVHNSGHYTIEACSISQFDAHIRAILDLPVPAKSLEILQPSIMINVLGGLFKDSHYAVIEHALSISNASIHLYGKEAGRLGRKMGHVTITAPHMETAEALIQPLINIADGIRQLPEPPAL